jgi:hypothetical protein
MRNDSVGAGDDHDDPPRPCRRGHARVTYFSQARGRLVVICRFCAARRYSDWMSDPANKRRRHTSQTAFDRRGRTPIALSPLRPTVEQVRAAYQSGDKYDEALREALALVEGGLSIAEAIDEVLGVVTPDELRSALARIDRRRWRDSDDRRAA